MTEAKYKDQILDTIDQLRNRKARPDLERICHMVERKYGCPTQQTQAQIERLVEAEVIIKVDYKGNTSYRNAAKWGKKAHNTQIQNTCDVTRAIVEAVRKIDDCAGANPKDIEKYLQCNDPNTKLVKNKLLLAIDREVSANQIRRLPNGNYALVDKVKDQSSILVNATSAPKDPPIGIAAAPLCPANGGGATTPAAAPKTDENEMKVETAKTWEKLIVMSKKGRPSNKRKRFKKTHGPDFVENYDSSFEEPEPKCDYCLLTAAYNYQGKPEDLLFCKDCNAKAHPSCMDYSSDLATRSRMSPWQCMDCKTCYVCSDSGDGDSMLFCDACDKGYHMGCHSPKIHEKPSGKWVCFQCSGERKRKLIKSKVDPVPLTKFDRKEVQINSGSQTIDGALGLPTPCESPVPESEQNKQTFSYFNVENASLTPSTNPNDPPSQVPDASDWSIDEVVSYFRAAGFPDQATCFRDQEIDGRSLLLLKRSDVLTGLSMKLGPALKIYNHVKRLQVRRLDGHLFG